MVLFGKMSKESPEYINRAFPGVHHMADLGHKTPRNDLRALYCRYFWQQVIIKQLLYRIIIF